LDAVISLSTPSGPRSRLCVMPHSRQPLVAVNVRRIARPTRRRRPTALIRLRTESCVFKTSAAVGITSEAASSSKDCRRSGVAGASTRSLAVPPALVTNDAGARSHKPRQLLRSQVARPPMQGAPSGPSFFSNTAHRSSAPKAWQAMSSHTWPQREAVA